MINVYPFINKTLILYFSSPCRNYDDLKISNKILNSKMSSSEKNEKRGMRFGQPSGKASEVE